MLEFDYFAPADGKKSRQPSRERYKHLSSAAEAVRYVIESLPAELVGGSVLEVEERRFYGGQIRELYNAKEFPLTRLSGA